ncbi:MAG: adenylosuccinate lyase [Chitinophagales bacterium]|nr:adenylosuccinate lyase [Chitinophagales bacterium]
MTSLQAISPIDGRYADKVVALQQYFSEYALIKYRVIVEVEYFIALSKTIPQIGQLTDAQITSLRNVYNNFSIENAERVKTIEKTTNHDVKAVEYFIKENITDDDLKGKSEFIHFGLTSQDINNTAIPLSLKDFYQYYFVELMLGLLHEIKDISDKYKDIPLLARTHGQPASPTRLGKEFLVFHDRLLKQFEQLEQQQYFAKFGGATGNFNAHVVAYPNIDWKKFADDFINQSFGMYRLQTTTQIAHYDDLAELFQKYMRFNTILIDFCRDIWTYISMDYFKQKIVAGEIGSSAMPHKVNPIDFENAEGNLGIANSIFSHLAEKLPISRLQRDLTDSTVLRNIGVPMAHTVIAIKSILKGLNKLLVNEQKIKQDLEDNWMVVAEAIQTVLRREAFPQPYEALKALTRTNEKINQQIIHQFIDDLEVSDAIKSELKQITPQNYTGI